MNITCLLVTLLFLSAALPALGHLCLVNPLQRGPVPNDFNVVPAPECGETMGPCGSAQGADDIRLTLQPGQNYTVVFQKNMDHFNAVNPGKFIISFGVHNGLPRSLRSYPNLRRLDGNVSLVGYTMLEVPDAATGDKHLFSATVQLPMMMTDHGTIQVIYQTNQPEVAAYYQCADIALLKAK